MLFSRDDNVSRVIIIKSLIEKIKYDLLVQGTLRIGQKN